MPISDPLVLASSSRFRGKMLQDAGLRFEAVPPRVDERAVEASPEGGGTSPEALALLLAEAKAGEVSARLPGRLVLGCDQTLSLHDRLFHKPPTIDAARNHLLALSGQTHHLNSAAVLAKNGEILWRHVSVAQMEMRTLTAEEIDRYLARMGDAVMGSVGAYQIEGLGITLFTRVDGDFWTIVGLPLLPVLAALREQGMLDV